MRKLVTTIAGTFTAICCVLLLSLPCAAGPTGTSGNTTFPMGSGTCDFYITGTDLVSTPAPNITLDTDTVSGSTVFGFDPAKSDSTKWHIVAYPAPVNSTQATHDIHIMWFPGGSTNPPATVVLKNAITFEQPTPQWIAVSPLTGVPGATVHIDGTQFDSTRTYYAQFGPEARGRTNATANSTASDGFSVVVPDLKGAGQVAVAVYEESIPANASTIIPFNGTNPNARYFTYTNTCPDSLNGTGIDVGAGRIQTLRQADSRYPLSTPDCGCAKADIVSPIPVNNDKFAVTTALAKPYRIHSWASGMIWADNTTPWYNPYALPSGGTARQTPVYADPLIACYTNDQGDNYYQQSTSPNTADNEQSVYGKGFHLAMPNPAMDSAATYNSGTDKNGYNQDCAVKNGADDTIQVGLSQMGVWRDTLVVYPTNGTLDPAAEPRYLPAAAKAHRQGDFDIEFVMDGPGFDAANPSTGEYLKMGLAQGSPFAQFTTYGTPGVMVAGVFPRVSPTDDFHGISAVKQYAVSGGGTLNYVILNQQVNSIGYAATGVGRQFTNWVSFALLWDPTTASLTTQNGTDGKSYLHLAFTTPAALNHFVVAGLPNQMANTKGVAYDPTLADNWLQNIAPYAFNYFTDSTVAYKVGKTLDGQPAQANHVNVYYTPSLQSVGPASSGKTVFLLQPMHYAEGFKDGRKRPLNWDGSFLSATGTVWADPLKTKYWINRGKLEAMAASSFDCTYVFPGILPGFPFIDASASRTSAAGKSYNLRQMAAAMIAQNYYLSEEEGTSSPATTAMDGNVPEDSYNVFKTFVRSAKMLPMLLHMQDINATVLGPDYHIGTPTTGKPFSGHNALAAFTDNLADAFAYYFGKSPRCSNGNKDSYYYSYYDPGTSHLLVYPATGAAGQWPTNLRTGGDCTPQIWDGYGTVTMLNDHQYTYGYPILAASILSMALKDPDMPSEIANQKKLINWWGKDNWGGIVDQMVMDIAYDPAVTSWYTTTGLSYPKMEWMDQWSGISWVDGFIQNSLTGHNANSPWEQVQAWAGILMWGQTTGRQDVTDLGIYLYTIGLYGLEAYRYNTLGTFVPDSLGDHRSDGTFLVKATQNFGPGGSRTDGTLPYFDEQTVTGKTMFDRQMSDTADGQKTMRVTYIFQSQLRADNTYNQTPIGQQYTSTYPIAPWSLAMTRDRDYMTVWAKAIANQNGKSRFTANYATNNNLLYALLGLDQTASWYQGNVENPLPVMDGGQLITSYNSSAFQFTQVSQASPYDWYWNKCTWSDIPGMPIWQKFAADNSTVVDKLSLYISNDKTLPEPLLDFYTFDKYGQPDFSIYATLNDGSLAPQAMAFNKNGKITCMAYNPDAASRKFNFNNSSGSVATLTVPGYSLGVSQ